MSNQKDNLEKIKLQLARLRRHYEASISTYDEVSLLDLSHSLRIWADLKGTLPTECPAFKSTIAFRSALPAKKVMRLAKNHQHIFAYMPGGVITKASNGNLIEGPTLNGAGDTSGVAVKYMEDGTVLLKNFGYIGVALDEPMIKAMAGEDVSRLNFVQWMGAEVVRIGYTDKGGQFVRVSLTREDVIRRVANALDGSHPSIGNEHSHAHDEAVQVLLKYRMGGVPLPYFILLKIAQDLVDVAHKLLEKN